MDDETVRRAAAMMGLGTVAFGVLPLVSPAAFGRLFDLGGADDPAVAAVFRSVALRDVAIGLGLWSAATHGGRYAPWLLARLICDAGDTAAGLLAIGAGARQPRYIALTALAAGAAGTGAVLHRLARADGR